jgi:MoxR-like ATPase
VAYGASPRGVLGLVRAAQALCLVQGERYVSPLTT